ncbi:MAG: hypothetical protein J7K34_02695 [Flavobacteriaceae bacterium]|nr:hypothetical protein [Flavobacteriaceae bacterium]
MISTNIFRAIGDFCTDILFLPYDAFRFTEGWWNSNLINAIFISIIILLLMYWITRLVTYNNTVNE